MGLREVSVSGGSTVIELKLESRPGNFSLGKRGTVSGFVPFYG